MVNSVFPEESVFRIDHYLGKETVQNILALRFANEMFEPIWNAHYVDHVQITMAEDIGLGGRAGYYDGIGAARDVIQNHLLQLLALTAMEEPVSFDPAELQAEKIKVLSATRLAEPLDETTSRGQYAAGWQGGEKVVGLLDEEGFSKDVDHRDVRRDHPRGRHPPLGGVPFYLRTGKRLGRRVTEIAVVFKRAPHLPFDTTMTEELGQNALVIRVQPDEGITLRFGSKVPGSAMEVRDVNMDFSYGSAFAEASPEAYERLILDVLLGEPSLFPVNAEVELSWKILDPGSRSTGPSHGKPEAVRVGHLGAATRPIEMLRRIGPGMAAAVIGGPSHDRRPAGPPPRHQQEARRYPRRGRRDHSRPGAHPGHRARHRRRCRGPDRGGERRQPRASLPGDRGGRRRPVPPSAAGRADPGRRRRRSGRSRGAAAVRPAGRPRQQRRHAVPAARHPGGGLVARGRPDVPAQDPLGRLAIRRITDATTAPTAGVDQEPTARLHPRRHRSGWSRITYWRALLAAALDQAPFEPISRRWSPG